MDVMLIMENFGVVKMSITKTQFENEEFERTRYTKKQALFMKFLLDNKNKAFTTKEIAKELYGNEDKQSVAKAYFVLRRLQDKGLIESKMPYWIVKTD